MSLARESPAPKLSVVIAAWNGIGAARACLASLARQAADCAAEVILAANFPAAPLEFEYLSVRVLVLEEKATVPMLRAAGVAAARGEIVALTEDHVRFDAGWCRAMLAAHELPHAAVGGSIDNTAGGSAVDWAMYFRDYAPFMPSNEAGTVAALSGANVSYKRAALEAVASLLADGFYETSVNEALAQRGVALYLAPAAVVIHDRRYGFAEALARCYHSARSYAARRVRGGPSSRRIVYAIGSLVLPMLLPARTIAVAARKRRHTHELWRALPVLVSVQLAWAAGEIVGYAFGEGDSGARWR